MAHSILSIRPISPKSSYPPTLYMPGSSKAVAGREERHGRNTGYDENENKFTHPFSPFSFYHLCVISLACAQPMVKPSPWGGHQGNGWGSGGMSWGRDHRRGSGIPGSVSHVSPLKKPFSSNVIAPPKFPRSGGPLGPKSWIEENMFRTDSNSNTLLPLQVCVFFTSCMCCCVWGGLFFSYRGRISGLKCGSELVTEASFV